MKQFRRYAIYYAPQDGAFADAAAAWLGWDLARGRAVRQPSAPPELPQLTQPPRKYGFHGTIKPPFRLAAGVSFADLDAGAASLAASLPAAQTDGLVLRMIEGFLALVPQGDTQALGDVAGDVVRALDAYRAPLTQAETARRRPDQLTQRQRELLAIYVYPYVMEEFQFHLTLSAPLNATQAATMQDAALAHFGALLPRPFVLQDLCLCGEDEAGQFHLINRYPLMAASSRAIPISGV